MKIYLTYITALLFLTISATAQTTLNIEGFGSVLCPAKMELQAGAYKKYVDRVKGINGISASKVVLQQKGLNDLNGGFDTYARVMIRISYENFYSINKPISQADVDDVNSTFKSQIQREALQTNISILSWNAAIATTLNGYKAIKFGYKRKIGTNPVVSVETYLIDNADKMYAITFENRTDRYNWASVFAQVKSGIKIYKN